jgi:DNA replication and repair protein RecF
VTLALSTLRLIAFRSYARADLAVGPNPIALAGPNGAGKTNILEAVSLLAPGRGLRRAQPADFARQPDPIGWSVAATLTTPTDPTALWTGAEADARRTAKRDDKAVSVLSLGRVARILWLTPALDRVFVEGPAERRRFLDRIALSFTPDHAEHANRYERAMRDRNRLLRDGSGDGRWLSALEAQMVEAGAGLAAGRRTALAGLLAAQDGTSAFPRAEATLEGPFEEDAPDAGAYAARLHDGRYQDGQAGRTLYGPHRSDLAVRYAAKDVPASACSTGEQKALLVSLILANARALAAQEGTPPILLLDEIAAHFDEDRRAHLFGEIEALGAQAWMTGTEWALFEALGPTAQRFAVSEGEGSSAVEAV